ncbi:hypothetical protein D3C71_152530 [compost metagenome]
MAEWTVHPDGGKLELFRQKHAVLASGGEAPDNLRLFVVEGFEAHPNVDTARSLLRSGGRSAPEPEACGASFIADLLDRAVVADDRIRPCIYDAHMFWSRSRNNRMCVFCKKADTADLVW